MAKSNWVLAAAPVNVTASTGTVILPTSGLAADSSKLGGQLPSYFMADQATGDPGYWYDDGTGVRVWQMPSAADIGAMAVGATASDSSKLGGQLPAYYLTATGTAADASKLGGSLAAAYAKLAGTPAFTNGLTAASVAIGSAVDASVYTSSIVGLAFRGKAGSSYDLAWVATGGGSYLGYVANGTTILTWNGAIQATAFKVSGTQVIGAQQTGLGATLGAATLSGTYATDLATLQALYNKVLALETKLKTHGLVAT